MLIEVIEKKNKPIQTKIQFTKKEWNAMIKPAKELYEKIAEKHETARLVYFIMDGDLLNKKQIN